MILSTIVARLADNLPLAASTDDGSVTDTQKRQAKALLKQLTTSPNHPRSAPTGPSSLQASPRSLTGLPRDGNLSYAYPSPPSVSREDFSVSPPCPVVSEAAAGALAWFHLLGIGN